MDQIASSETKRNHRGILLFLLAMLLFGGMIVGSMSLRHREPVNEVGRNRLDSGQAQLLYRIYLAMSFAKTVAPTADTDDNNELLRQAVEGWQKLLQREPTNLQVRFAIAVAQAQFGGPAAKTLDAAPVSQQRLDFLKLRSLVLDPAPKLELLQDRQVARFISRNPTHRLWLADVYRRAGNPDEAQRQLRLGYGEVAPYITALVALLAAWGMAALVGLISLITLIPWQRQTTILPAATDPVSAVELPETAAPATETGEARPRPFRLRDITLAQASLGFIAWLVLQIGFQILVQIIMLLFPITGDKAAATLILSTLSSFFAAALVIVGFYLFFRPPVEIGLKKLPFWLTTRVALAVFFLNPVALGVARLIEQFFRLETQEPSLLMIAAVDSIAARIILLIIVCTLVPITEETIFRGVLFRGIRSQWGVAAGIVLSSLVFAAAHADLAAAVPLFLFAVGLAWSVQRTGSLVPAIIAHGLFNFFQIVLLNIITW